MTELARWDNFYVIVGSAAGALIGLQFVVLTLIAQKPPIRAADAGAAYGTPTIVHFSAALFLSAALHAPWDTIVVAAALWGGGGLIGVVYSVIVARRMHRQTIYRPQFEDWLFHVLLPLFAYGMLAASAISSRDYTRESLFAVGAAALLMLFVGIHNAWDNISYHVLVHRANIREKQENQGENDG